ncbi:enoyl-CoA hydratase [Parvibium lacunae]|uniref:enoyl-CoA hydratase n=1 Tax=Parvibium lacunae TaxID=1888893 RepID=A0A368L7J5_9BURK|nr:enoyl-CoA hydratase [Parvibium lacunae]RCS59587.1 enoyl-CoA hydratase [Parvibium lacunae]
MTYTTLLTEEQGAVGLIRLNRPAVLNALNDTLMDELGHALTAFEQQAEIRVIVLTGSDKAFAAGADIAAMRDLSFMQAYQTDFITRNWETLKRIRKPVLAAVAGFALGGGCELAMMCDVIYAADNAKFGQPEVKLGVLPGAGGTQRLPRAVGKAKAMDLCFTGRMLTAQEAEQAGLVARLFPAAELLPETLKIAQQMAAYPLQTLMMIKESIQRAYELPLQEGLLYERRLFQACFATHDQKEGMSAFLEKRPAQFKHE